MAYKTITLLGDGVRKEAVTYGVVYPGMLLQRYSATQFQPHGVAGGNSAKMFAVEDDLQGNDIDTVYTVGTRILGVVFRPGDEVFALLKPGETVAVGDFVESATGGYLQKHDATNLYESAGAPTNAEVLYTNGLVGIVLEALDLSQSSLIEGPDTLAKSRIKIEIM
jgi:hypothetical protein